MSKPRRAQLWPSFWRCWPSWYILIVLLVYVPAVLCTLSTGTFKPPTTTRMPCEISFLEDYLFHINCLVVFPVFFLMLPKYVRSANDCLRTHIGDDSIPFCWNRTRGHRTTPVFRKLLKMVGVPVAVAAVVVGVLNIHSLRQDGDLKTWFTPSLETIPTSIYFFTLVAALGLAAIIFVAYHFSVMLQLRGMTLPEKASELEWSVTEGGPIHETFSSYLHLLYPVAMVPIAIILSRTFRMNLSPFDPVTLFNMAIIPLGIAIWVIYPFSLTGISKVLRMRRRELLRNNAKQMTEIWNKLRDGTHDPGVGPLSKTMDSVARERDFLEQRYPVLLLSKQARIIPALISLVPIVAAIGRMLFELLKGADK